MKFPSLSSLTHRAGHTFLRFPLAILLAALATSFAIRMVPVLDSSDKVRVRCTNAIVSCYLGMLLSIALTVWAERRNWARGKSVMLQSVILVLVVVYFFTMPDELQKKTVIRWVLYALGLHWMIAVIGFLGGEHINSFWQYNKKLFLRILTSVLYTTVLYAGLALAFLAIDNLFNVNLSYKWYADTWLLLVGVFNTWFFLSGFPADYADVPVIDDYPKGLKIFTQYVLLPILTVYMVILYAYLFKIVITAHWPTGWVAYLVLGFSVAGILALLLIYPLRNDEGSRWINGYSRFFYFALFPLLVMLGFAIWKRVAAYGITELRYFVLLLAAWLFSIAVYFLRSRNKNIRHIPLSLCLLAFLSSFGPWSVFNVSRYSQQARLKGYLEKYGLLKDGKVTAAQTAVPEEDRKEISTITDYIVETHGYQSLQPWFPQNLDSMMRKDSQVGRLIQGGQAERIMALMHVPYKGRYEWDGAVEPVERFSCSMQPEDAALSTEGLPYLVPRFDLIGDVKDEFKCLGYKIGDVSLTVCLDSTTSELRLLPSGDSALHVPLATILQKLPRYATYGVKLPPEEMTLPFKGPHWKGRLFVRELFGMKRDGVLHVTRLMGDMLIGQAGGGQ
ncbi:DUF4153 domain-containing protein [Flavitalea sp. BT771]|uniref:DUF4153 domain-containing protein n=1 Tax=Flavitalea sp. BT771 TaxID=3063329 RepID=UPI0026E2D488|nr:DUF4153 domain-containing protein [Flavitalea sp. BT771]MDO6432921.1 DUF4153 domain-containing protein [Flavitalea sp. BT771]MDV6221803.1 DUF4153 domain-containing protein [Flavitalea sp. BT771]